MTEMATGVFEVEKVNKYLESILNVNSVTSYYKMRVRMTDNGR